MKPLLVLIIIFVITIFAIRLIENRYDIPSSANIAMSAMLFFSAMGHFIYTKGMTMMIPYFIPLKTIIVYFTGVLEIVLGIGLLFPCLRSYFAWITIFFFILLLPANINAAIKHINYQKGSFNGSGLAYLWFRIPLQIFFILWIYLSSINYKIIF